MSLHLSICTWTIQVLNTYWELRDPTQKLHQIKIKCTTDFTGISLIFTPGSGLQRPSGENKNQYKEYYKARPVHIHIKSKGHNHTWKTYMNPKLELTEKQRLNQKKNVSMIAVFPQFDTPKNLRCRNWYICHVTYDRALLRTLTLAETSGLMYPEGICTQTAPVHLFDQLLRIRIHFKEQCNKSISTTPHETCIYTKFWMKYALWWCETH